MKKSTLIISSLLIATGLFAQNSTTETTEVLYPVDFHISKPLSEFPDYEETENLYEKDETKDREHRMPAKFDFTADANGAAYGNDPSSIQTTQGTRVSSIRASFAGQSGSGYPPDPSGAVGPTQFVQAVNATPFKVYNKTTGAQVMAAKNLSTLWSPATGDMGDPIVMYDKYADRWFLSQFGQVGSANYVYIAISTSSNPAGTYYTYTYTSASFPDYLKFAIWSDGYYMTSNQETGSGTSTQGRLYVFERDQMIAGVATARSVTKTFTVGGTSGFWCPLTADADGTLAPAGTACPFFWMTDNSWSGSVDGIKYCKATVNWVPTTPTLTIAPAVQITTAAFDGTYNSSWNDIPQPGAVSPWSSKMLDGIGGVSTYRAQYRRWTGYNTIVMNWGVLISNTARQRAIKWVELREQTATPGVWTLYQQGTYAPDTKSRWVGSIAMDDNGSIGLCYARSSAVASTTADCTYPSLCYTGRLATDPLGTMSFAETVVKKGTAVQTATNRFGDYSQTTIDPTDGTLFYHTGEYLTANPSSWIYSFKLPLATTGIDEKENQPAFSVSQSDNLLNVMANKLPSNDQFQVDLFDVVGKEISDKKVTPSGNSFETTIDVSGLAKGSYLVRVGNPSFQKVIKVVVQ
jgi:hypothetical protein